MNGPSALRCGRCGSEARTEWRYCQACGAPMAAPGAAERSRRGAADGGPCASGGTGPGMRMPVRTRSRGPFLAVPLTVLVAALVIVLLLNSAGPVLNPLNPLGPPEYSMGTGAVEYSWVHERRTFSLEVNITTEEYREYREYDIPRQARSFTQMIQISDEYVTSEDRVIKEVAKAFERTRADLGLDRAGTAWLVLSFVQSIPYVEDSESVLRDEYWRFPVETLQDQEGDCEDKVFLFASIMEALDYDAVVLYFEGHAAAGIDVDGTTGSHYSFEGKDYYFCETTAEGWRIGDSPSGLSSAYIAQVN